MSHYANIFNIGLEHPSVKQVIEIAEEILNEKKILNIDSLIYRAKKRLKLPRKGLNAIIQFLVNNKILVNRSKFTRRTVLSNSTRKIIYIGDSIFCYDKRLTYSYFSYQTQYRF